MAQVVTAGLKARSQVSPSCICGAQAALWISPVVIIQRLFHTHIHNQLLLPLFLPIGLGS